MNVFGMHLTFNLKINMLKFFYKLLSHKLNKYINNANIN
jgi:hypothetical protein